MPKKATSIHHDVHDLRSLLEAAPDSIVVTDEHGTIQFTNRQTEKLFGYDRNELLGKKIETLIPQGLTEVTAHDRKSAKTKVRQKMDSGIEVSAISKDGGELHLEVRTSEAETDEGRYRMAFIRDISERRGVEERYQALVSSAPDGIVTADNLGLIIGWNAGAQRIFGFEAHEIIGQPLTAIMPPRYHDAHLAGLKRYLDTGQATILGRTLQLEGQAKDGREIPIELTIGVWYSGTQPFFSAIIRDISEKKAEERKLLLTNAALASKNQEVEQFTYVASHDLKEPLRTVTGYISLLKEEYHDKLDDRAKLFFDRIVLGAERMRTLIEHLLDYSRLGRDKQRMMVDCDEILGEVLHDLESQIMEAGAEITAVRLPQVNGFQTELRLLFQNLLSNALKFRKKDELPQIQVACERKQDWWLFRISDNGIGIKTEFLDRIFVIFKRLHPRDAYPGSGIGLTHCKKIVELHGGRIWAESELGKGSTFYFTLPA